MSETDWTLRLLVRIDLRLEGSVRPPMCDIERLIETYLEAERELVAAVDAAGGIVRLPDGRSIITSRGEFDAVPGRQRRRAWLIVRKNAAVPARR